MALVYQQGLRWLTRPWSSARPLVVTGAMDVNSNLGRCRIMDPDKALSSDSAQMTSWTWVTVQAHQISMTLEVA